MLPRMGRRRSVETLAAFVEEGGEELKRNYDGSMDDEQGRTLEQIGGALIHVLDH